MPVECNETIRSMRTLHTWRNEKISFYHLIIILQIYNMHKKCQCISFSLSVIFPNKSTSAPMNDVIVRPSLKKVNMGIRSIKCFLRKFGALKISTYNNEIEKWPNKTHNLTRISIIFEFKIGSIYPKQFDIWKFRGQFV